jgi:hypothetical protein
MRRTVICGWGFRWISRSLLLSSLAMSKRMRLHVVWCQGTPTFCSPHSFCDIMSSHRYNLRSTPFLLPSTIMMASSPTDTPPGELDQADPSGVAPVLSDA